MPKKLVKQEQRPLLSGDEVTRMGSPSIYVITRLSDTDADICLKGTDLEWFRVPITDLPLIEC